MTKYSADTVAQLLVSSGARSGPLYRRLSDGLAQLIDRGELPPLAQLPAERTLAEALTMSRTTVVAAYRVLREEGKVDRRQGSGTVVLPAQREAVSTELLAAGHAAGQFVDGPLAAVDFATAALPALDLVAEVAASLKHTEYQELAQQHHGYHLRGLPELRARLADWYTGHGLPTAPEEVLITSGAQQALELIARGCLQPGDRVVGEGPTYRGAVEAFTRAGARLETVPTDTSGMDVRALDNQSARLVYLQSPGHNPTGAVLAPERGRRLIRLMADTSTVFVDDTSLYGTGFADASRARPALGTTEQLVTVGSLSKLFWGGLRLGWIRGSARVVSRLAQVRGISDLGSSLITQAIAARLLDHIAAAAATRQEQLSTGYQALTSLLGEHLPDWTWQQPSAGASLWVQLPQGTATHFAQVALRYGVALLPGAVFAAPEDRHTRLPFALSPDQLADGVGRLSRAWHAYVERGAADPTITASAT